MQVKIAMELIYVSIAGDHMEWQSVLEKEFDTTYKGF